MFIKLRKMQTFWVLAGFVPAFFLQLWLAVATRRGSTIQLLFDTPLFALGVEGEGFLFSTMLVLPGEGVGFFMSKYLLSFENKMHGR